jgi:hypothetical protein
MRFLSATGGDSGFDAVRAKCLGEFLERHPFLERDGRRCRGVEKTPKQHFVTTVACEKKQPEKHGRDTRRKKVLDV